MFDSITQSLQSVFSRFARGGALSEDNIKDGLREIRQALLEADVHFKVAKDLIQQVTDRAVGQKVIESVRPAQQIVKIFHEVLTEFMAGGAGISLVGSGPTVIMLAGLQGSGKTTTAGKLANFVRRKGRHPMLVAADLQRPAAIDQLTVLGQQLGVPVFRGPGGQSPPEVCLAGVAEARKTGRDVVILDTAGRLHIDELLMAELAEVKSRVKPHQILLVVDSMTGQDAVNSAKSFHERLGIDGVILTKLDGDTRGGAAISIKAVTGAPICFVGVGEKLDNLEEFHAERLASRILGMGDVVSLVERAQEVIEEKKAEEAVVKLLQDEFTFEDFLFQLRAMKKLGPLKDVLGMLPGGMGAQLKDAPIDERALDHVEALICSMSREERLRPEVIDGSRRKRIARGAGRSVEDVNSLLKQYQAMRQMMKQLKGGGMFGKLAARMMPGGGSALREHKTAQVEALRARGKLDKQRRKIEKQARKANRRRK